MSNPFRDIFSGEIKLPDTTFSDGSRIKEVPSDENLKSRMDNVFILGPENSELLPKDPPRQVTLEDGTVVQIPATPSQQIPPQNIFFRESICKADDLGHIYITDSHLNPNDSYELNNSIYTTDDKGRITNCESDPQRTPENPRDNDAQRDAGGEDRRTGDQGGHLVGRDLGGDSGEGNLVAMDSRINQSDYKRMENEIKEALDQGKSVHMKAELSYSDDSRRPDKIKVTLTIDGKQDVYKFDNNLDNSLMEDVPDEGKDIVQSELDDTDGEISSIREEYDKDGNLVETTVTITCTDENGNNRRTKVTIENQSGGEK